jgi:hypothetical protein
VNAANSNNNNVLCLQHVEPEIMVIDKFSMTYSQFMLIKRFNDVDKKWHGGNGFT